MADCMNFPKRWEDFLHDYEFEDSRRIYTNGSRLIPSFRVKQMMEHYLPTVDAVPVVRCKDCKWLYDEMDDYCCRSHRGLVRICENSFCSYGERKDGDGNG